MCRINYSLAHASHGSPDSDFIFGVGGVSLTVREGGQTLVIHLG